MGERDRGHHASRRQASTDEGEAERLGRASAERRHAEHISHRTDGTIGERRNYGTASSMLMSVAPSATCWTPGGTSAAMPAAGAHVR